MIDTTYADGQLDTTSINVTNYWQYYQLKQPPFEDTVQYAMYYPFPYLQAHLQFLHLFCRGTNPLLLIEGELGSGKSMLIAQFLGQLDNRISVFQMKGKSTCNAYQLVADIAQGFQLPLVLSQPGLHAQLDAELAAMRDLQKECVLVIDDADLLPPETLAALMHLIIAQDPNQIYLHIVLASELRMQDMLENLARQHGHTIKIPTLALNPLTLDESQNYLKHRLTKAGLAGKMPFTKELIEHIHRLSGGLPGRINRVAQQTLIDMLKPNTQRIMNMSMQSRKSERKPERRVERKSDSMNPPWWYEHRVKILSGFLLVVVAIVLWQTDGGMKLGHHRQMNIINSMMGDNAADPLKAPALPATSTSNNSVANVAENKVAETKPVAEASVAADSPMQMPTSSTLPSIPASAQPAAEQPAASTLMTSNDEPQQAAVAPVTPVTPATNEAAPAQASALLPAEAKVATTTAPEANNSSDSPLDAAAKQQPAEALATVGVTSSAETKAANTVISAATPVTKTKPTAPAVATAPTKDEEQLMQLKGYTLQMLGSYNIADLQRLMKKAKFSEQPYIFETQHNGKPWYVLVYGQFENPQAAKDAVKNLPEAAQQLHPWIRPLTSVHEAIKARPQT